MADPSPRPGLGLRLALQESDGCEPMQMSTGGGGGGMLQLVGGDGMDMGSTFEVSANGTLRTHGFVIRQDGIQESPDRRARSASAMQQAAAASSSSSSAGSLAPPPQPAPSVSPLSPLGSPPSSTVALNPNDFLDLGPVGKGACGVVRRALHRPSLRVVALKEINIFDQHKRHQFVKELTALGNVASPHIVGFAGAWYAEGSVTVLLQYCNRLSLLEQLQAHGPFPEIMLQRIALHTFKGLEILRTFKVIHRDIKPGNILVTSAGDFLLTDFGVVTALEGTRDLANTFVGTTIFMAPERVAGDNQGYSYASDVWSLGITLWYLAVGTLPYRTDGGFLGIAKSIRDDPVPSLPPVHPVTKRPFSPAFRDLLERCLRKDPVARATAAELVASHPFLVQADAAWEGALRAAQREGGEVHPLMRLSDADLADLDAILQELYRTSYASGSSSDPRRSLMHQARLQKLTENLANPRITMEMVAERFDRIYAACQAAK